MSDANGQTDALATTEPVIIAEPGIYRRLVGVMEDAGVVEKKRKPGSGVDYAFQGIDDVESALRPALVGRGVFVEISVETMSRETATKSTRSGEKEVRITTCRLSVCFVNVDNPSDRVGPLFFEGEGEDYSDKADGKAIAYALKALYLATFHLRGQPDNEQDEIGSNPGTRQHRQQDRPHQRPRQRPGYIPKVEVWKNVKAARAGRRCSDEDVVGWLKENRVNADKITAETEKKLLDWVRSRPLISEASADDGGLTEEEEAALAAEAKNDAPVTDADIDELYAILTDAGVDSDQVDADIMANCESLGFDPNDLEALPRRAFAILREEVEKLARGYAGGDA